VLINLVCAAVKFESPTKRPSAVTR
jgi:hypothetical protein